MNPYLIFGAGIIVGAYLYKQFAPVNISKVSEGDLEKLVAKLEAKKVAKPLPIYPQDP